MESQARYAHMNPPGQTPSDPSLPPDVRAIMSWALDDDTGSLAEAPTEIIPSTPPPSQSPTVENSGGISGRAGTAIGPFTLVKLLGQGGFGEVWMAEQSGHIRRTIALKLIKPGMASADVMRRFEAERQALAVMDHPNIAKVFDAGATFDGRPWFAMEMVYGSAITTWCDEHRLPVRERLQLFMQVCAAVQHAHQKAVLHRDLKPSNILIAEVDGHPVPKVIDFGIAKALEQPLVEQTLITMHGQFLGTPQYMSPEQVSTPGDVDTRSDVYALGLILYELLTGQPAVDPLRLKQAALEEMCRIIREEEPQRPSTRIGAMDKKTAGSLAESHSTTVRMWLRELAGDLDWIIVRALHKDRNARYASVSDFASDVNNYIEKKPINACKPSFAYYAQKWLARHKTAVITGMLVATSVLAGLLLFAWQAFVANKEKERAIQAEQIAFMRDFLPLSPERCDSYFQQETRIAAGTSDHWDIFSTTAGPSIMSSSIEILSCNEEKADAERLVEFFETCINEVRPILGRSNPETLRFLLHNLGMAQLACGDIDKAISTLKTCLEASKNGFGEIRLSSLATLANLAAAYAEIGRYEDSISLYFRGFDWGRKNLGIDHLITLRCQAGLMIAYLGKGATEKAADLGRSLLAGQQKKFGPDHPECRRTVNCIANALIESSQYNQAVQLLETVAQKRSSTLGDSHMDTLSAMCSLATALENLGQQERSKTLRNEAKVRIWGCFGLSSQIVDSVEANRHEFEPITPHGYQKKKEDEKTFLKSVKAKKLPNYLINTIEGRWMTSPTGTRRWVPSPGLETP